jgi:hypothetical protein
MKKLLLILLCFISLTAFSQNPIWSEDFSNGIPSTWTNSTVPWEYRGPSTNPNIYVGSRGGLSSPSWSPSSPIQSPSVSNGFMIFDSDYYDNGGGSSFWDVGTGPYPSMPNGHNGFLITESIDLTNHFSVSLKFNSYYSKWAGIAKVAFSINGGLSFTNEMDVHPNIGTQDATPVDYEVNISIPPNIVNNPNVKIKFRFDGTIPIYNSNFTPPLFYGYYFWMIDDIELNNPCIYDTIISVSICDTSYTWDGMTYDSTGLYTHVYTGVNGCDSIQTLDLTIGNSYSTIDTQVSCDAYTWVDGNTYTASNNSAIHMFQTVDGCDSLSTLNLTIKNSTSSTDTHIACDEFMWYCDGNIYTSSNNTATYVYTNAVGCDSTVTLDLTINNSTSNSTTATSCDAYTWAIDGNTYTTSGTYTDVSTNASGCNHTETLELSINYSPNTTNILGVTNVNFLQTEIYSVGQNLNSIFSWHLNSGGIILNGINTNSVEVQWGSIGGSYDLYVVETAQNGCSDTALIVVNAICFPDALIASITQSGNNLYAVTSPYGIDADWYNIQTEDTIIRIWLMEEGASSFSPTFDCSYFIVIEDENGCSDTSAIYYYEENAKRIGNIITSPNPTSNIVKAKFDNSKNQNVKLELINSNGIKLDEFFTTYDNLDIDLSKYPSGTYYLYFNSEDAVQGCRLEELQKISSKIILNK